MKNRMLIIAIAGLFAAFMAVVVNLASGAPAAAQALTIQATIAAVIALSCGALTFRRSGGWRFLGIAMIGPSVFVLADCGMRLLLLLKH
jgi:hypothetical protein